MQYYLSGNYDDDHGIDPTNKARRFAGHANLSFPISQKLDVSTSFNYVKAKYHLGVDYGDGVLFNTLYGLPILPGHAHSRVPADPARSVLLRRVRQHPGSRPLHRQRHRESSSVAAGSVTG